MSTNKEHAIAKQAFYLAMYVIESALYTKDADVREAVDNLLLMTADLHFDKVNKGESHEQICNCAP